VIILALVIMIFAAISQSTGQTVNVSKPIAAEIVTVKPMAVVTNLKSEAPSVKDRASALLDQAKKNIVPAPKAPSAIDLLLSKGKKA